MVFEGQRHPAQPSQAWEGKKQGRKKRLVVVVALVVVVVGTGLGS